MSTSPILHIEQLSKRFVARVNIFGKPLMRRLGVPTVISPDRERHRDPEQPLVLKRFGHPSSLGAAGPYVAGAPNVHPSW